MGTDPRQYVRPGEKLRIAASQINFLNAMMRQDAGFTAGPLQGYEPGRNIILCRNSTGVDITRWGVMEISGIEINPETNATSRRTFEEMPCVTGVMPTATTGSKFVIAVEPIKSNAIGRVAVAGVVQAIVNVSNAAHGYAAPIASNQAELASAASGPCEILWKASGTGNAKWALLRLQGGSYPLRIGRTASAWNKGSTATITLYEGGTPPSETAAGGTISGVINKWGDVPANKWVGIQMAANGYHYLVVAEC